MFESHSKAPGLFPFSRMSTTAGESFVAILEGITPQSIELVPGIKEIALEKWLQSVPDLSKLEKLGQINLAQDLDLITDDEHTKFYEYVQRSFNDSEAAPKLAKRQTTLQKVGTLFKRATTKVIVTN